MFEFDVSKWVPAFIMKDKNGYAIAKAIEAGMNAMNNIIAAGVKLIADVDTMPEWRLDELAWEFNVLYDYTRDIDVKRKWIKEAFNNYSIYGTAAIIEKYFASAFDTTLLEEWYEYGGDPYHFRITVTGEYTEENDEWARKAVEKVKNVRSVLDNIVFNSGTSTSDPLLYGAQVSGQEVVIHSKTV